MAGAIDLFGGSSSITGTNLFKVDKDPLQQLDEGVEDVIGKQAKGAGGSIISIIEAIIENILGIPAGSIPDVGVFFDNILSFLGDLNPLDPNFIQNLLPAAAKFISEILHPTDLLAMLVPLEDFLSPSNVFGVIPLENLAMDAIAGILGSAQAVIDAILASVGFGAGTGTVDDIFAYFTDFLSMFNVNDLASGTFNPLAAIEDFIKSMLLPSTDSNSGLHMLAGLVGDATQGLGLGGFVPIENLAMDLINELSQSIIDTIFGTIAGAPVSGKPVQSLIEALMKFPNDFVTAVGGSANLGADVQATWDNLISGLVGLTQPGIDPDTGLYNPATLLDLFQQGTQMSSWAWLGNEGWKILGVRDNSPMDHGLLSTSMANFALSHVGMQPTAPTIGVTEKKSAMGFIRTQQANDKGVVSWLGGGKANITACYVNVWQMDTATGDLTLVHRSPNIVGDLPGAMDWVIYSKPDFIPVEAGDTYGIEITVVGSGTHTVTGTTSWLPAHPSGSVFPKKFAATRDTTAEGAAPPAIGAVIPHGNVLYSDSVPWFEWGIYVESASGVIESETITFDEVSSGTVPIPSWANFVDVIAVGAGAGGGGGSLYGLAGRNGGGAGQWATGTWARGTDFPDGTVLSIAVRAGGAHGETIGVLPTAGGDTTVSIPGATITATGGAISWGQDNGQGAGHIGYPPGPDEVMYYGGGQQNTDGGRGLLPGGGGASGPDLIGGSGGPGANGAVWIVFRQT